MKTILTDKYNLMPWMFSWLGLRSLWLSYAEWQQGATLIASIDAAVGLGWLAFAVHRMLSRSRAWREGCDPAIVSIREHSQ